MNFVVREQLVVSYLKSLNEFVSPEHNTDELSERRAVAEITTWLFNWSVLFASAQPCEAVSQACSLNWAVSRAGFSEYGTILPTLK